MAKSSILLAVLQKFDGTFSCDSAPTFTKIVYKKKKWNACPTAGLAFSVSVHFRLGLGIRAGYRRYRSNDIHCARTHARTPETDLDPGLHRFYKSSVTSPAHITRVPTERPAHSIMSWVHACSRVGSETFISATALCSETLLVFYFFCFRVCVKKGVFYVILKWHGWLPKVTEPLQ